MKIEKLFAAAQRYICSKRLSRQVFSLRNCVSSIAKPLPTQSSLRSRDSFFNFNLKTLFQQMRGVLFCKYKIFRSLKILLFCNIVSCVHKGHTLYIAHFFFFFLLPHFY